MYAVGVVSLCGPGLPAEGAQVYGRRMSGVCGETLLPLPCAALYVVGARPPPPRTGHEFWGCGIDVASIMKKALQSITTGGSI